MPLCKTTWFEMTSWRGDSLFFPNSQSQRKWRNTSVLWGDWSPAAPRHQPYCSLFLTLDMKDKNRASRRRQCILGFPCGNRSFLCNVFPQTKFFCLKKHGDLLFWFREWQLLRVGPVGRHSVMYAFVKSFLNKRNILGPCNLRPKEQSEVYKQFLDNARLLRWHIIHLFCSFFLRPWKAKRWSWFGYQDATWVLPEHVPLPNTAQNLSDISQPSKHACLLRDGTQRGKKVDVDK